MPKNQDLVIVGMSGGVDSSVAAIILKQQGFNVAGMFMKNWEEDDDQLTNYCSATKDLNDAQDVCDKLNIDLHKVNFATEYWDKVFNIFIEEHKAGRTPNPDILCNTEIKFKMFLNYAKQLNANFIATGHYARTCVKNQQTLLLTAIDQNKDQSYFLHGLNQMQLSNCLFPLGEIKKPEVREIARKFGLNNYNKKDSTGICFIGERKFKDFLSRYLPTTPGKIVNEDGKILGSHDGVFYYTIGQRKGLNIGGKTDYHNIQEPWYVIAKDMSKNQLIVARGKDHPKLYHQQLIANKLHWINQQAYPKDFLYTAKIRYRQLAQECYIKSYNDLELMVTFKNPQRAITPGQYIVFYDQQQCLGGGIIKEAI